MGRVFEPDRDRGSDPGRDQGPAFPRFFGELPDFAAGGDRAGVEFGPQRQVVNQCSRLLAPLPDFVELAAVGEPEFGARAAGRGPAADHQQVVGVELVGADPVEVDVFAVFRHAAVDQQNLAASAVARPFGVEVPEEVARPVA